MTRSLAVDFDAVLGDTKPLLGAWLADAERRYRVELGADLDESELDRRLGNWRPLLERFAEEHAAVYLRPHADANAALRRLRASGVRVGAFTDSPDPLVRVAAAQLGVARHLEALETGRSALDRLLAELGRSTVVIRSREELLSA